MSSYVLSFVPEIRFGPGRLSDIAEKAGALAGNGAAVLVISQDLDELLMLSDRLAVINVGVLSDPLVTATASVEEIGLLMGGAHGMGEPEHGAGGLAHVA